jgi:hypothetical protein
MTFCMHAQEPCINLPQQARPYANLATRLEMPFSLIQSINPPQQAAAWGGSHHLQS